MKVSIIITCYNLGPYVEEALDSALRATHADSEIILVDDGSTDPSTCTVLDRLEARHAGDAHVQIIRQTNTGLSGARNAGIRAASGDCILPLDADNKIRPAYPERAADILSSNQQVGVVYVWAERFGAQSGVWEFPAFDRKQMLLGNGVEACSAFRRQVWEDNGGYDEERFKEGYEDWDFWLGAMEHGWDFYRIPEVLFDYRIRTGSMVSACNEPDVRQKLVSQLIEKHKALYADCWPELLVCRELTTLSYEKAVAGYHQRYVEALAEFHAFAREWDERCRRLESETQAHAASLHELRHVIALQRWIGRLLGRSKNPN